MSLRRRSLELGIPHESLRRIIKLDLNCKPYHIQTHQRLTDAHKDARVAMCQWFLRELHEDDSFQQRIWFSDEAHFYLNGHVNNKNHVFWGSSAPGEMYEKGLHDKKVAVWAAMSYQGVIEPFFF